MTTVGRSKRKRASSAGTGVLVKGHTRTPRGPNAAKAKVKVDTYRRGKPRPKRTKRV